METPRPSQEHRRLSAFAGTWIGEETIHPSPWDPWGGPAVGRTEARMDLDGFYLITDYVEERDGHVRFRGHGVYGWDPVGACYTMSWFDSMGLDGGIRAAGHWVGDTLTFERSQGEVTARYVYQLEGEGRYTFRIETSADGTTWRVFMEGTYVRQ